MKRSREDVQTLWATFDAPGPSVRDAFGQSICPDTLPALRLPAVRPAAVELRGELGRGGMGVVHLGYQVSLRREVAVKVVPDGGGSRDQRAAAREALVTAHLEHPHIVPVYTVEEGADGEPLIVMKRIDGVRWSVCIEDPTQAPRMRVDDPLAWHLGVFLAVCRAVQFAHERGILHRDVKPDNVLIGGHGDVYLMDWGLAVALDPAQAARAPLASQVCRIAGTPGYMAPEMVRGDGEALGPASDVYLLGATLHEVLTTHPRHGGADVADVLHATLASEAHAYGATVPPELAAICNRATHREPSKRHPTAAALGAAVGEFAKKRPALRFLAEGRSLLGRLRDQLATAEPDEAQRAAIDETIGSCRAALDEALSRWPDNDRIVTACDEAYALMAAHEMDRGNLDDARKLLERMARVEESLRERLEALSQDARARQREYDRLKKLEREVDPGLGGRTKALLIVIFGLAVFAHNVIYGRLRAAGEVGESSALFLTGPVLLILLMGSIGFFWRRGTFRNQVSRQVLYVLLAIGGAVLGIRAIGAVHDIPGHQTYAYLSGVYAYGAAQVASMIDRRIHASAGILFAGAVASVVWPAYTFEIIGAGVLLAMIVMAAVWWQRGASAAADLAR